MTIANRIKTVQKQLHDVCDKYHMNINKLKLLAVSKTHPATAIQAAFDAGITEFGESYIQEALEKIKILHRLPITWHFIGPIQSNKTRLIAHHFDWVQSVDRSKILQRLNDQRPEHLPALNICMQVNYFNEPQKKGASLKELPELLDLAQQLPNIKLRGIMAIPPKEHQFNVQRINFEKIAETYAQYQQRFPSMDCFSIGMSHDIEAAIAAGSSMVRIGTAIFGPRK